MIVLKAVMKTMQSVTVVFREALQMQSRVDKK